MNSTDIIDILKIVLPALLVLVTAYIVIQKMLKNDEYQRHFELKKKSLSTVTPIRLRAYERLALVLERTDPNNIIVNVVKPGMTAGQLQAELLNMIRQEFGHNASQQIYVSSELWTAVKVTKQSIVQLVNACSAKTDPGVPASKLAELILNVYNSAESTPAEGAMKILKNEVQSLM